MGSRGFEVSGSKLIRSPSKSQSARQSMPLPQLREDEEDEGSVPLMVKLAHEANEKKPAAGSSLLASFKRSKSFAPATKDTSTQLKVRQPFQRVPAVDFVSSQDAFWGVNRGEIGEVLAQGGEDLPIASGSRTTASAVGRESSFGGAGSSRLKLDTVPEQRSGIFNGMTFHALGEARCASVKNAVENAGGTLVDDPDVEVDITVVRLVRFASVVNTPLYLRLTSDMQRQQTLQRRT